MNSMIEEQLRVRSVLIDHIHALESKECLEFQEQPFLMRDVSRWDIKQLVELDPKHVKHFQDIQFAKLAIKREKQTFKCDTDY